MMPTLTDAVEPTVATPETVGPFGRFWLERLNDPRDLPFAYLIMQCTAVALGGIALFFTGAYFWYFAAAYALVWLNTIDRYILMLHCTSHIVPFKAKHRVLNKLVGVILAPFFGQTPMTYFMHHMGMHHPENNLADDRSTTMPFQRDRLTHWLRYFGRFITVGIFDLVRYHFVNRHSKMARKALFGELSFIVGAVVLGFIDLRATLFVFVGPLVLVRLLMMAGNWAQHAFIDAANPANPYGNSITCINTRYNRRCFNDGYHIYHHVKPRHHWSQYPAELQKNIATYGEQDAIVIEGYDYFQIWLLLMLGRHQAIAKKVVRLPGAPSRTDAEMVSYLKSRLAPVPFVKAHSQTSAQLPSTQLPSAQGLS